MKSITVMTSLHKYALIVIGMIGSFFAPIQYLLLGSLVLVLFDLITGIMASRARKEELRSRCLFRTVSKLVGYTMLIILAHLMTVLYFPNLGIDFASLAASYVAFIEFKSFCENMKDLTGNELWDKVFNIIPDINVFKGGKKD